MGTIAKTTEAKNGPLLATLTEIGSVCTVSLSGEFDLSSVEVVRRLLREFETGAGETIVFDLERLEFIDSAGIAVLHEAHLWLEEGARRMRIVPSSDASVRRIFTITGLDERLPFVSDGPPA